MTVQNVREKAEQKGQRKRPKNSHGVCFHNLAFGLWSNWSVYFDGGFHEKKFSPRQITQIVATKECLSTNISTHKWPVQVYTHSGRLTWPINRVEKPLASRTLFIEQSPGFISNYFMVVYDINCIA